MKPGAVVVIVWNALVAVCVVDKCAVFTKGAGFTHPSGAEPAGVASSPTAATSSFSGATHSTSPHDNTPTLPSTSSVIPVNDVLSRIPHDVLMPELKGTTTLCVLSITESILPAVPQYRLKSAAR